MALYAHKYKCAKCKRRVEFESWQGRSRLRHLLTVAGIEAERDHRPELLRDADGWPVGDASKPRTT